MIGHGISNNSLRPGVIGSTMLGGGMARCCPTFSLDTAVTDFSLGVTSYSTGPARVRTAGPLGRQERGRPSY
eukprot:6718713-Alexandrium_andersonii.AAC.1